MSNPTKQGEILLLSRDSSYHGGNGQLVSKRSSSSPPALEDQIRPNSPNKKLVTRYKECLKNHAAAIGGNATDGCGEFMPAGDEGTLEALKCSACNCHRNFHRKEIEFDNDQYHFPSQYYYLPLLPNAPDQTKPINVLGHHHCIVQGSSYQTASESEEKDDNSGGGGREGEIKQAEKEVTKKRFRTKFSQEQKEKMLSFAEKAGWRIQRLEESDIQQFCQEIGIKRRVLKVWMHNNKHNFAKRNPSIIS
ncbi:Zinc-finger homeodomain protein [Quillaja saponaria]|uniref:Zinc-finger homeodomain protein n=1 Tax=Quillaja saponaria TaxID=32244 RepID=A0AAD7VHE3_QUISA|nr:Zinc-finger homeodomain protein [Quillaja saponaria]